MHEREEERLRKVVSKWKGLLGKMIEESHCAEVLLTFLSTEGSLPSQHFFTYS